MRNAVLVAALVGVSFLLVAQPTNAEGMIPFGNDLLLWLAILWVVPAIVFGVVASRMTKNANIGVVLCLHAIVTLPIAMGIAAMLPQQLRQIPGVFFATVGIGYMLPIVAALKFGDNQGYGEALGSALLFAFIHTAIVLGEALILFLVANVFLG